jgi:hypothetical protein
MSYARANKELATKFLLKFKEQVSPSKTYNYNFWTDNDILVGEQWNGQIIIALKHCDVGLLLVSPAFLGSQYINEKELPKFIGKRGKPVIPVMLQPVDFERHDLKGLLKTQIFRLDRPKFRSPKAFGDCLGNQRDQFTQELFKQVEKKLDKLF